MHWTILSLDVLADSCYNAAHIFYTHAKKHRGSGLPIPTPETIFEVTAKAKSTRCRVEAPGLDSPGADTTERATGLSVRQEAGDGVIPWTYDDSSSSFALF